MTRPSFESVYGDGRSETESASLWSDGVGRNAECRIQATTTVKQADRFERSIVILLVVIIFIVIVVVVIVAVFVHGDGASDVVAGFDSIK